MNFIKSLRNYNSQAIRGNYVAIIRKLSTVINHDEEQ